VNTGAAGTADRVGDSGRGSIVAVALAAPAGAVLGRDGGDVRTAADGAADAVTGELGAADGVGVCPTEG
jgi:hypothetical protein